jgi:PD-(D/E)XK nuclease superfamily
VSFLRFIPILVVGFRGCVSGGFENRVNAGGMRVEMEVAVPVYFRGEVVGNFRADAVVNDCVLLELKGDLWF